MAQLFHLNISDGDKTVTFFSTSQGSGSRYQLADGGFQIGLPKTKRAFGILRPGVGIMTKEDKDARECTIKFSIYGDTRADVMSKISNIESILKNVSQRATTGRGERSELKYAWEGSDKASYLEIYGGELAFPDNIWSVEGMHGEIYGQYVIPELELKLWLSPEAYAISLRSTSMIAVPLSNSYGSGNTTGLKVVNTGTNYVEIAGGAIEGDTPVPIRVSIDPGDANFTGYSRLYMGLQRQLNGQYPTNLIYDSKDTANSNPGSQESGGYGGTHRHKSWTGPSNPGVLSTWGWEFNNTKGIFYGFLNYYWSVTNSQYVSIAMGYTDFVTYGIAMQGPYFQPRGGLSTCLGVIEMPPGPPELATKGVFHEDLWVTTHVATSGPCSISMDYMDFLPIGDGIRFWNVRMTTAGGTAIDDGWEGIEYLDSGSKIWLPFYGILEPLRLVPGTNQRVYFKTSGGSTGQEHTREIKVQIDYVPTYKTMVD